MDTSGIFPIALENQQPVAWKLVGFQVRGSQEMGFLSANDTRQIVIDLPYDDDLDPHLLVAPPSGEWWDRKVRFHVPNQFVLATAFPGEENREAFRKRLEARKKALGAAARVVK